MYYYSDAIVYVMTCGVNIDNVRRRKSCMRTSWKTMVRRLLDLGLPCRSAGEMRSGGGTPPQLELPCRSAGEVVVVVGCRQHCTPPCSFMGEPICKSTWTSLLG